MARSPDALVNADLLIWARKSAQMSLEVAAEKLGVKVERLASWERGGSLPTVNQVRTMSRVYEQCFAAFYLPEAPSVFKAPTHDYRLLAEEGATGVSTSLAFDMRRALDRRSILIELAKEEVASLPTFALPKVEQKDPTEAAIGIRRALEVPIVEQRRWRSPEKAFADWRAAVERLGVLVFQSGKVELEEMRGYSINKRTLPIVVVNRKDRPAGRCFTLMHELCHLALRSSGVCDLAESPARSGADWQTEVFCNEVAGNVLVPSGVLLREPIVQRHEDMEWANDDLADLAREFAVSREVILRRLLTLKRTTQTFYEKKRKHFVREYEELEKPGGFVPPYIDAVSLSGRPYVKSVLQAFFGEKITASDASDYLGVRIKHFDRISEAVGLG